MLRELPDRHEWPQNQEEMDYDLETVAALFLRANQERVSGLELIRSFICCVCSFIHDTHTLAAATGSNDIYHHISATPIVGDAESRPNFLGMIDARQEKWLSKRENWLNNFEKGFRSRDYEILGH